MTVSRRLRILGSSLAAALAVTLVGTSGPVGGGPAEASDSTTAAAPAAAPAPGAVLLPTKDPFYRYNGHRPLARIKPGTVLKRRTVTVGVGPLAALPAEQLLYRTRTQAKRPSVTVTTVINPGGAAHGIVAYLSFYDALGAICDPSYTLRGGDPGQANQQLSDTEAGLVQSLVTQGYAVTVPDFEGEGLHWVAGQESGWNTLDGIRATEHALGAPSSSKVGLFGYSGGSIAGDWASELAPRYAPELNLVGTAIGGIPVDLAHNLKYVNGSDDWSGVIPAVLVSLGRAFGLKVAKYESAKGRRIAGQVHDQCIGSFNGNYPGLTVQSLLKKKYRHFLKVPVFARIVNKLLMGTIPGHPRMPMLLGVGEHDGKGDDVMIRGDVEALAHEYCSQGVSLQFHVYSGANHSQAGLRFFPEAEQFLAERFAGVPMTSGCADVGRGNSLKPLPVHHSGHHHSR